jgi:hypothetical protein
VSHYQFFLSNILFLKCLPLSWLTMFRSSGLIWLESCNYCNITCFLQCTNSEHFFIRPWFLQLPFVMTQIFFSWDVRHSLLHFPKSYYHLTSPKLHTCFRF